MPDRRVAGLLNDVATEELAHLEMVGTIVRQLDVYKRQIQTRAHNAQVFFQHFAFHCFFTYLISTIWPLCRAFSTKGWIRALLPSLESTSTGTNVPSGTS